MDKISVIIPIFKVEAYLIQCVDSVLKQSYDNLEIILVDDGSPDLCPQICDEYKKQDARVKVVHQKNMGLSAARNTGLNVATGDWIAFVDSDDYLELDMYEHLRNIAKDYGADIVSCGLNYIIGNSVIPSSNNSGSVDVFSKKQYLEEITLIEKNIRFEVWNKLFKREVISDTRFIEGQICEDIYFNRTISNRVKKLVRVDLALYNYRKERPGNTNFTFKVKRLEVTEEIRMFEEYLNNEGYDLAAIRMNQFALDFSQQLYIMACYKHQTSEIKNRIIRDFNMAYVRMSYFKDFKHRIFKISPSFYYFLKHAQNKLC